MKFVKINTNGEMFDMDEEIMKQHEDLFKKLEQSNTGYSYN